MAKQIKVFSNASILFVTANSEDEIVRLAIQVEPAGYLVKPVNIADLKANLELIKYKLTSSKNNSSIAKVESNYLSARTGQKLQLIPFKNIKLLSVETKNYVTLLNDENKQFAIRDSLKNLINDVLPDYFIRTHSSYGVNINFISFIDEKEQMLHLKTNEALPIGKSFKENVYQRMNIKS